MVKYSTAIYVNIEATNSENSYSDVSDSCKTFARHSQLICVHVNIAKHSYP